MLPGSLCLLHFSGSFQLKSFLLKYWACLPQPQLLKPEPRNHFLTTKPTTLVTCATHLYFFKKMFINSNFGLRRRCPVRARFLHLCSVSLSLFHLILPFFLVINCFTSFGLFLLAHTHTYRYFLFLKISYEK